MATKARAKLAANYQKLEGKYVLVYLNYGEGATEESPKWALVGGQKSGNLDMSADSIDASDKTSGGWGEKYPGIKSTELSIEGNILGGDEAYQALKEAFIAGEPVDICRYDSKNKKADRNWYSITELGDETPHDDVATFSLKLEGIGAPKFYESLTSVDSVGTTPAVNMEE
ncbi:phage tail tube protein [Acidaminococcus intestini]|uniref:phage tail tube protein n=1 Tax=Acidaminococcus intestini TaxID=187327 RepID=UPI003AB45D1B